MRKNWNLNATHQLLVFVDDDHTLGENLSTIKKNTEAQLEASREVGLEVNTEETKYVYGYVLTPKCRTQPQFTDF
jgi:hypothetical protein